MKGLTASLEDLLANLYRIICRAGVENGNSIDVRECIADATLDDLRLILDHQKQNDLIVVVCHLNSQWGGLFKLG
jgi:hypothetical protein